LNLDPLEEWRRTHYSNMITPEQDGQQVTVFGWVEDIRDLGGVVFIVLRDKEGLIQVTVPRKKMPLDVVQKIELIGKQFVLGIRGKVKAAKEAPRGVEVIPTQVKILATATYPLPLDPTGRVPANIDVRLDSRALDLRRPECRAIFRIRHEAVGQIREFLSNIGYVEVHTPRIIVTATEGGSALFPVEYFDNKAFLAQSPQLYKEQLITIFEKVFEVGTFFRAEESHTRRHINEFVSIDIEEAFVTMEDVMKTLEALIHDTVSHVADICKTELKMLNVELKTPQLPFKRYTYDYILKELREKGLEIKWGEDIPTPSYRELERLHEEEYYFIVDWPTKEKPFYIKPKTDNPEICYAFDLMCGWIEIASGGSRVDSKEVLISRLREQNLNPESFKFHLNLFDYGFPPHAGWAVGLERLLMALVKRENVREVVLFPRDRFRLTP